MRIIQLLPVLHYGDAVGNNSVALYYVLKKAGYETEIYAGEIDKRIPKGIAKPLNNLSIEESDIAILHLAIGTELNYEFAQYPCKKVLIYHNITPPEFFGDDDKDIAEFSRKGLESVSFLADKVDYCITVSEYNKKDLRMLGFRNTIDVIPILIPFADYNQEPDEEVIKLYSDDKTNLIFVGRVIQNKKQEDIIETFAYYKKYYNSNARLFIVGSYDDKQGYYKRLSRYVDNLGLEDVFFTGKISFSKLIAYYKIADVFLCMSEHEGFCVPIVEAMYFQIPVIAYKACAVPETLGNGGLLIDKKVPILTAGLINRIVTDNSLREAVIDNQREQLQMFTHDKIEKMFLDCVKQILSKT